MFAFALSETEKLWLREEAVRLTRGNQRELVRQRVFGSRDPKAHSRPRPANDQMEAIASAKRQLTKVHLHLTSLAAKESVSAADLLAMRLDLAQALPLWPTNG